MTPALALARAHRARTGSPPSDDAPADACARARTRAAHGRRNESQWLRTHPFAAKRASRAAMERRGATPVPCGRCELASARAARHAMRSPARHMQPN
ncbi:hypothetical protein EGT86_31795 [Burkholderia pseudomallei]|nr:hypothetical protein [Burkholderia pseudomallei]QBI40204.1 hypothetical protein EXY28_10430 [Burkholderia pseudomallei]QBI46892.1 hypothetical protein EXY72_10490 [Burkholderia pseudomallei]RPA01146.1 hypothetical protein EGT86_31795 [Burkholderia pseudomallei]